MDNLRPWKVPFNIEALVGRNTISMNDTAFILIADKEDITKVVDSVSPLQLYSGFEIKNIDIATLSELYKMLKGLDDYVKHICEYEFIAYNEENKSILCLVPPSLSKELNKVHKQEIKTLSIEWKNSLKVSFNKWTELMYYQYLTELCKLSSSLAFEKQSMVILFCGKKYYGN